MDAESATPLDSWLLKQIFTASIGIGILAAPVAFSSGTQLSS